MSINQLPTPPPFKHLTDKAHLIHLRSKVALILSNRVLTNFTDHSVYHSDSLTALVDDLVEPLQMTANRLNEQELTVLYAACYLHDIGMQYENAGETDVIRQHITSPWNALSETERRELLRQYHNEISAEMVMASVNSATPIIGMQMTDDFFPPLVAALCEAHTLPVDSARYLELTNDSANVRMALLSGFLRITDILDESHRRATREQARTLMLDMTSQTHWWRHYYTENITIDQQNKLVTVWFDFPKPRTFEYKDVIPQLQMPWIEAEFSRHMDIFHKYGFGWSITSTVDNKPYSSAQTMPDVVLSEMYKQLFQTRKRREERQTNESLENFRSSVPHFDRRLNDLEEKRSSIGDRQYLIETEQIAADMWAIDNKRNAVEVLKKAYHDQTVRQLSKRELLGAGIKLSEMLSARDDPRGAANILSDFLPVINESSESAEAKFNFWNLYAEVCSELGDYNEALKAYKQAEPISLNTDKQIEIKAQIAELQIHYGEIESLAENSTDN